MWNDHIMRIIISLVHQQFSKQCEVIVINIKINDRIFANACCKSIVHDLLMCAEFIEEQKKVKGILTVSFSTFNEFYSELNSFTDLTAFEPLTERSYSCTGGTALLDSFAKVIDDTGTYLSKLEDSEKPEKVLIVVITDGEENSSIEISSEVLKEKVETKFKFKTGNIWLTRIKTKDQKNVQKK